LDCLHRHLGAHRDSRISTVSAWPTVIIGIAFAYFGGRLYAWRKFARPPARGPAGHPRQHASHSS
jgi:hypothetical protein